MKALILIFLLFPVLSFSQKDTLQELTEVKVAITIDTLKLPVKWGYYIDYKSISELNPNDLGEVLQKFAGVSLKSYGGLGGLKTFSYRSMGSQHAVMVVDGFTLQNAQTGQVNLGQLSIDNIDRIYNTSESDLWLLPVTAHLSGASFMISTFDNSFSDTGFQMRSASRMGSFGHFDLYGSAKFTGKKFFFSTNAKYREADGNYPFSYSNGLLEVKDVRQNNYFRDYNFGNTFGIKAQRLKFRIGYNYKDIDQELPGAVVYYNTAADEQLTTKDLNIFTDLSLGVGKFRFRVFANANRNKMRYLDPSYLNSAGMIDVLYLNDRLNTGINFLRRFDQLTIFGGIEENLSALSSGDSSMKQPFRIQNLHLIGADWRKGKWKLNAKLGGQFVIENIDRERDRSLYRITPSINIWRLLYGKWKWQHGLTYRNSFRLPSFNELYYNNVGNNTLEPEKANQLSYELSFQPVKKELQWSFLTHVFANRIEDLIVAIPTKNLFIWSMQNIGKTNAFGGDVESRLSWKRKSLKLDLDLNYTFQRTIDVTDENSPTYFHQVAYIPVHTGNADLGFSYKSSGVRLSNLLMGSRYSLNENVSANLIPGFWVSDLTLFHRFELKKSEFNLQFNIRNLFDVSYAYVRSYIMPGRSYMLTLSYAIL